MSYDEQYYGELEAGSRRSAEVIVPMVCDLVGPKSVVDVGCGLGSWLSSFRAHGVEDILGIDHPDVPTESINIEPELVRRQDLTSPSPIGRRFDLAVCLEVAEHLPEDAGDALIESLAAAAPVVLFSAAIPGQGGMNHINEQWPGYWADKFKSHSFLPVDCIRKRIWDDPRVEWWYAQNILLFVAQPFLASHEVLKEEFRCAGTHQLSLVHPVKYQYLLEWSGTE